MINQLKNNCRKVRGQFAPKKGGSFDWILQSRPESFACIAIPSKVHNDDIIAKFGAIEIVELNKSG